MDLRLKLDFLFLGENDLMSEIKSSIFSSVKQALILAIYSLKNAINDDIRFYHILHLVMAFSLFGCASDAPRHYSVKKTWHSPNERPYTIRGVTYYPQQHYEYNAIGYASWYGPGFHKKPTATGKTFNQHKLMAAHRTLPLPCVVTVKNLENGKKIKIVVNDRGPFVHTKKRIIDLSHKAAILLGFERKGCAKVQVKCLPYASQLICKKYKRKPYPLKRI